MKQTFTEEELTQALQSLKAEATEERFLWLTLEAGGADGPAPDGHAAGSTRRSAIVIHLRRWGVAAMLTVAAGVGMMMWERFVAVTPSGLNQTTTYNRGFTPACNLNAPSGLTRLHEKSEGLTIVHEKPKGLARPQTGATAPGESAKGVSPVRATERPVAIFRTTHAATPSVPDDLTQLLTQTAEALDEAESRREEMTDIVEQYFAFIEP